MYYQRMWAEHIGEQISEGDFARAKLPSTAVLQHVTAQQRYCKQVQVQVQVYKRYIDISCLRVIWADLAFPVSMKSTAVVALMDRASYL